MQTSNLMKDYIKAFEHNNPVVDSDIIQCEDYLNGFQTELTQVQFDALVSFIFAVGESYFESSGLKNALLYKRLLEVGTEIGETFLIGEYDNVVKSVRLRRLREKHLFLSEPNNDLIPILRAIDIPSYAKLEGLVSHSTYRGQLHK